MYKLGKMTQKGLNFEYLTQKYFFQKSFLKRTSILSFEIFKRYNTSQPEFAQVELG